MWQKLAAAAGQIGSGAAGLPLSGDGTGRPLDPMTAKVSDGYLG